MPTAVVVLIAPSRNDAAINTYLKSHRSASSLLNDVAWFLPRPLFPSNWRGTSWYPEGPPIPPRSVLDEWLTAASKDFSRMSILVPVEDFKLYERWADARHRSRECVRSYSSQLVLESLLHALSVFAAEGDAVLIDGTFPVSSVNSDELQNDRVAATIHLRSAAIMEMNALLNERHGDEALRRSTCEGSRFIVEMCQRVNAPYPSPSRLKEVREFFCITQYRSLARVGILGNPSDQLNGKALASTIENFGADVWIAPSESTRFISHPIYDSVCFGDLDDVARCAADGYNGGLRLMHASCRTFHRYCEENDVKVSSRGFVLAYHTTIPRQVGLAGSSALVVGVMRALCFHFGVEIPIERLPSLVLEVEARELQIHAGLMDRVAQVYEGLVRMDFDSTNTLGGTFVRLPSSSLSFQFFLAFERNPSESSRIHSNVKERWRRGDPEVVQASLQWAQMVMEGCSNLSDLDKLAELMDRNFSLRRKIYGDECLGMANLRMVELAREHNASAKLPGSGGAVLLLPRSTSNVRSMIRSFLTNGFAILPLQLHP